MQREVNKLSRRHAPVPVVGIDIGGTKCAVARLDPVTQDVRTVRRFPTQGVDSTLERILETVETVRPTHETVFGISCGSPLDSTRGLILSPPNLPGWNRVAITDLLTERFGGQAYLMNDANAGALAEWRFGAGKGTRNMIFMTHGTGMGAGLILDGRLYEGTTGDAGEVGHIRLAEDGPVGYGKPGSFEGFCSGGGIAQLARGRIPGMGRPTAKDVAEAAERGSQEARDILAESGYRLGVAIAILIDILNPEAIVLGSIYCRAGRFLEPAMREALTSEALAGPRRACRILPAQLGENTGNVAAVSVALYRSGYPPFVNEEETTDAL